MALIELQPTDLAGKQQRNRTVMQEVMRAQFIQTRGQFVRLFNLVWKNPTLTPQEVFDGFGTDAASLFAAANATKTFLNALVPGTIGSELDPPQAFTIENDGTVVVDD